MNSLTFSVRPVSGTEPVRWGFIPNFPEVETVEPTDLPPVEDPVWEARYDNDTEFRKHTTRRFELLEQKTTVATGRAVQSTIEVLSGLAVREIMAEKLGCCLYPDPHRHGGGLHVTRPGGYLHTHLDYAKHPILPDRERRVNLIAFMNRVWEPEWGGEFVLTDPSGVPVVRVPPTPGALLWFETGDLSYHGHLPVTGPVDRVTMAVYLLSDARPGTTRTRALFMPRRDK